MINDLVLLGIGLLLICLLFGIIEIGGLFL